MLLYQSLITGTLDMILMTTIFCYQVFLFVRKETR